MLIKKEYIHKKCMIKEIKVKVNLCCSKQLAKFELTLIVALFETILRLLKTFQSVYFKKTSHIMYIYDFHNKTSYFVFSEIVMIICQLCLEPLI